MSTALISETIRAASIKRRILELMRAEKLKRSLHFRTECCTIPPVSERFLLGLSVHATAMFRDPSFYLTFRKRVVPLLRTYPTVQIWVAGCSTGEEVYSLAILLQEEGFIKSAASTPPTLAWRCCARHAMEFFRSPP